MSDPSRVHLVDTAQALHALVEELSERLPPDEPLGVDTEFHAERRYAPELMLVQLAARDGRAWIIDPRRVDLRPLAPILAQRTWVAHGAQCDVRLLRDHLEVLPPVLLDTQVLAGLAGHGFPRRLADLSEEVLGELAGDGCTLSDWSKRPLTAAQLAYAADDARIALRLVEVLGADLPPERQRWWRAAGQELIEEACAEPDPDDHWRGLAIAPRLAPDTRRILHRMYAWREQLAREKNQPTWYVLSNGVALNLARRRPASLEAMRRNRRVPSGLLKRHGDVLITMIEQAMAADDAPPPVRTAEQDRLARALECWAMALEPELGIAAGLLLPPDLARRIASGGSLRGWRQDALGDRLGAFLRGDTVIGTRGGRLAVWGPAGPPARTASQKDER